MRIYRSVNQENCLTDNEAVWRNGGSSPQKMRCEFESFPPAGSSVEAATTPSRWDVVGKPRERSERDQIENL
jgi:hypothetical protein